MAEEPIYSVTLEDISKSIENVQGSIADQRKFMAEHLKMTNLLAKNELGQNKRLKETSNHWKTIQGSIKESYSLTMRMARTGLGFGIGLGVAAIGGGYGMAKLSQGAANDRDKAKGVGASIGELNAISKSFRRFFDNADAQLSQISTAKADENQITGLTQLLGKTRDEVKAMKEADIVADSVPAIKKRYQEILAAGEESFLGNEGYRQSKGLAGYSLSEIKRIGTTSDEEINTQGAKFRGMQKDFALSDPDARKHEDLADQIDASWKKISTAFQNALVPLTPQLEGLSKELSSMITAVVGSGDAHKAIEATAKGLKHVLEYMASDEAQADAHNIKDAIHSMAGALKEFSEHPIDFLINGKKDKNEWHTPMLYSAEQHKTGLGTAALTIGGAAVKGFAQGVGGGIHAPTNKDVTMADFGSAMIDDAKKKASWMTTPLWGKGSKKDKLGGEALGGVLTRGEQVLSKLISGGEGTYNSMNKGTGGGYSHSAGLTKMTLGEVMEQQRIHAYENAKGNKHKGIFAAGRYQFIPDTLKGLVNKTGADKNALFDEKMQDTLFRANIPKKVQGFASGKHNDVMGAIEALSHEWASFPSPSKGGVKSFYGAGNKALHSLEETKKALLIARNADVKTDKKTSYEEARRQREEKIDKREEFLKSHGAKPVNVGYQQPRQSVNVRNVVDVRINSKPGSDFATQAQGL
jgi:muramidase (phage lysozyme)